MPSDHQERIKARQLQLNRSLALISAKPAGEAGEDSEPGPPSERDIGIDPAVDKITDLEVG